MCQFSWILSHIKGAFVESIFDDYWFTFTFSFENNYFHHASGRFIYEEFQLDLQKTRSHNVNHSFRIFKMVFSYWLVGLFVSVRPVVALIRLFCLLLTNECLLLTHITSHPRGSRWTPFEGPSRPRVIIINSYNPLHFVYSI